MAKAKTQYVCQQCGASFGKWMGQCTNCGAWNSLTEQIVETEKDLGSKGAYPKSALEKGRISGRRLEFVKLRSIVPNDAGERLKTGFKDLDMVLGGGILPGSVTLLTGQPGIGKSTILMQICAFVARTKAILYVSGEESAGQVRLRAERLGAAADVGSAWKAPDNRGGRRRGGMRKGAAEEGQIEQAEQVERMGQVGQVGQMEQVAQNLNFAASTSGNDIAKTIESGEFGLVIVDSIQTLALDELSSAPGTVSQVTNCGNLIIRAAKRTGTAVIIVGHVTKEGTLAGPKVLEHLVDVVLNFEGDRYGGFKTVRAVKNRFGSTNEVAIFEMMEAGLIEVENPSAALLAERTNTDGSVILATLEGNRPILVEIQALATKTNFGYPKRTSSGFDLNRLNLLLAVMERRTKLRLAESDIFINVVGGMKVNDAGADLAVCMAIASAAAGRKLGAEYVVFGEVGLGGEIRSAFRPAQRIAEAKKLGFLHAIGPATVKDEFVVPVKDLRETLIRYVK